MKNPEQFVKSVDTLVDAYEKGNLQHMSPCNCAVGNLIAYNVGNYRFSEILGGDREREWSALMNLIRYKVMREATPEALRNEVGGSIANLCGLGSTSMETALMQAKYSGYTPNEIERIEAAFEKCEIREDCKIGHTERNTHRNMDPIDGLLRAVEVLGDIHEIPEETVHCMKDKIKNKTYKKSFELQTPPGSRSSYSGIEPFSDVDPSGDPISAPIDDNV